MTQNQAETTNVEDYGHLSNQDSEYCSVHQYQETTPYLSDIRSSYICKNLSEQEKSRMRWIVSLGLLLPALAAIIGVVTWAVSAEVVMNAKRDSALKMLSPASKFLQHRHENGKLSNSNKLKLNSIENRLSNNGSSKIQGNKNLKTTNKTSLLTSKLNSTNVSSNSNVYLLTGLNSQNSKAKLQTIPNQNLGSVEKSAGVRVAEVIDKLVAQRKKQGGSPHIVVVAPMLEKKRKLNAKVSASNLSSPNSLNASFTTPRYTTNLLSKDPDSLLAATRLLAQNKIINKKNDAKRNKNFEAAKRLPISKSTNLKKQNLQIENNSMSRFQNSLSSKNHNVVSASHQHASYLPSNRIAQSFNQMQNPFFQQNLQQKNQISAHSQFIPSISAPIGLPSRNNPATVFPGPQQYGSSVYNNFANGHSNFVPRYGGNYQAQENAPLLSFHAAESGGEGTYQEPAPPQGLTLHFGGGPMGGGGQLMTSPLGIFKTLLLPLLPRPRVNLNGKVVFGLVLENGSGSKRQRQTYSSYRNYGR